MTRSAFPEWAAACQKSVTTFMNWAIHIVLGKNQFLQIQLTTNTETGIFMDILRRFFILICINYSMYAWETCMFYIKSIYIPASLY